MDKFVPFVSSINTNLIAPVFERINYLRNSRDSIKDLRSSIQNLKLRMNGEGTSTAPGNAGQVDTDAMKKWREDVREIEKEANAIEEEYIQGTCVKNCWSIYEVSKKSVNLKKRADDLKPPELSVAPSQSSTAQIQNQPLISTESSPLQQLVYHICHPESRIIAVHGMQGVGKTTLVRIINSHFIKENSRFDTVIMVTVSATLNIQDIRTRIGERLGLDLSNSSEDGARDELSKALWRKKFLLILDDVRQQLDLKNVGIIQTGRSEKGSKIVLTTQNQDVRKDTTVNVAIEVQPLSGDEAWTLFVEKAGRHVTVNPIKALAERIVRWCEGLPLAIVIVARAMANRHGVQEWKKAATQIEESVGMEKKEVGLLNFSFHRLKDDMLRHLFLYCACFPEDHNIRKVQILDFCIGEGLVDRLRSLTAVRNEVEALILSLKVASMLEDGDDEDSVRMHDMMREFALLITSSNWDYNHKLLIKTGGSIVQIPQANEWEAATRISLMNTGIKELPELEERCPKLATLLVRNNLRIHTIPKKNFFELMDHLSILDLSYTSELKSLPDSLSSLVNLRVLRLQRCSGLETLPALGMLSQLQVLDLCHCDKLKHQILKSEWVGGVCRLRYLDVSWSQVSLQAGVISTWLVKLEELRMEQAEMIRWWVSNENENENENNVGNNEGIDVRELSHLTHLTSLCICFKDIIISDWFKPLAEKMMNLELIRCRVIIQDLVEALNESQNPLKRLRIEDCEGVTCVPTVVEDHLSILNCADLEKVLDEDHDFLSTLKELRLELLPNLERICVGYAQQNCFGQLLIISIEKCHRLKTVFTEGMSDVFNNLKSITVASCDMMEVIIETDDDEEEEEEERSNIRGDIHFPRLEYLRLQFLPALTDLCRNCTLQCPLLGELRMKNCPKLKKDSLKINGSDEFHFIDE